MLHSLVLKLSSGLNCCGAVHERFRVQNGVLQLRIGAKQGGMLVVFLLWGRAIL